MGAKTANRWMLIIAGFIISLCLGTAYAWSVLRPALQAAPYGLKPAESVIPFSVFLLLFGGTFTFSGRMIGRIGPRRSAMWYHSFSPLVTEFIRENSLARTFTRLMLSPLMGILRVGASAFMNLDSHYLAHAASGCQILAIRLGSGAAGLHSIFAAGTGFKIPGSESTWI